MGEETQTPMRGNASGLVSGYLLKLLRGAIGQTQAEFAERIAVDVSTVQGWESGRRPLTSLRHIDLMELRLALLSLGAPAEAVAQFDDASMADLLIGTAIEQGEQPVEGRPHPLAQLVHRRSLSTMITWPITGERPDALRGLRTVTRRGPVPDRPLLDDELRTRFFDHMLTVAESTDAERTLLRRQAMFLLGFDKRPSSVEFLNNARDRSMRSLANPDDTATGLMVRSGAMALARRGELDAVRSYIDGPGQQERHAQSSLSYWAYWIGELGGTYTDDADLCRVPLHTWSGSQLLTHLLDHLTDDGYAEMNVHTLSDLVLARPGLLEQPELRSRTSRTVERALDAAWSGRIRDDLVGVQYAARMADR